MVDVRDLRLRIAEYFEIPVEVIFSTAPFPRLGSKNSASALALMDRFG